GIVGGDAPQKGAIRADRLSWNSRQAVGLPDIEQQRRIVLDHERGLVLLGRVGVALEIVVFGAELVVPLRLREVLRLGPASEAHCCGGQERREYAPHRLPWKAIGRQTSRERPPRQRAYATSASLRQGSEPTARQRRQGSDGKAASLRRKRGSNVRTRAAMVR